jgi:cell wall-associated NlpC family hydrolase
MSRRDAPDPRLTLARTDLAAASLEGIVAAGRYEPSRPMRVTAPVAPIRRAPDLASEWMDELIYGEAFEALVDDGGFVWGQARRDGYVGFVPAVALAPASGSPTHRVAQIRTRAFAAPSIEAAATGPFSLNALVRIEAEDGLFGRAADGGWFRMEHLAPIGRFERDPALVAERFVGAPYLQGGRTSAGLDGAALIQQALYACGHAFPRDADQQLAEGREIGRGELARGDLLGWRGHVGLSVGTGRLIHASADHMAVVIEPLDEAIARFEAGGGGPTVFRRV